MDPQSDQLWVRSCTDTVSSTPQAGEAAAHQRRGKLRFMNMKELKGDRVSKDWGGFAA